MAITNDQLKKIKFVQLRGQKDLIRAVGDDIILTASKGHIYLNGMHMINIEFIEVDFLTKYIEKVIQSKRKADNARDKGA